MASLWKGRCRRVEQAASRFGNDGQPMASREAGTSVRQPQHRPELERVWTRALSSRCARSSVHGLDSSLGDPERRLLRPLTVFWYWDNEQMLLEAAECVVICYIATGNQCICSTSFAMNFKPNDTWNWFETGYKFFGFLYVSLSNFNHDSQV